MPIEHFITKFEQFDVFNNAAKYIESNRSIMYAETNLQILFGAHHKRAQYPHLLQLVR